MKKHLTTLTPPQTLPGNPGYQTRKSKTLIKKGAKDEI
jgi:hypothetical protein